MRRRLIPVNVVIASLLFILLSFNPDQTKPPPVVIEKGKMIYVKACQSCHQPDGLGIPDVTPSLSQTESVLSARSRLITIVLNGLTDTVVTDDVTCHNSIPSHLTNQEVADLLTYVRNSFGNKAGAVTAREVKKVRIEKKL
ncbi:MAG: cytochrome c [Chitinophagaceae bacterium]|nr:cytochrome c [Chitinophagaceae bacterium]